MPRDADGETLDSTDMTKALQTLELIVEPFYSYGGRWRTRREREARRLRAVDG